MLKINVRLNKNEKYETSFYLDCHFSFQAVKDFLIEKLNYYYNLSKGELRQLGMPSEYCEVTKVGFYVDPAPSKKGRLRCEKLKDKYWIVCSKFNKYTKSYITELRDKEIKNCLLFEINTWN